MPVKRQPKTLYKRCIEIIYAIYLEGYQCNDRFLFSNVLPMFPPSILSRLVSDVVEIFVKTENSKRRDGLSSSLDGFLADLLECFLSDSLTVLDLSPLARLEINSAEEIVNAEKIISKSLSRMNNLVSLSFKDTQTRQTIPIFRNELLNEIQATQIVACGDELLKVIGFNCPKLKSLDVSYNDTVTNTGLQYLWGESNVAHQGCPELEKLIIFGCNVSVEGVAKVLEHLNCLQVVGYKETGSSLMLLSKKRFELKLNLVYLNNMGCGIKTEEGFSKLRYSCKMSYIVVKMCPYMTQLKVHVRDATLQHVVLGPYVDSVHLILDFGADIPVGGGLICLVQYYGLQLTVLSLHCYIISIDNIIAIGRYCKNLVTFAIKCTKLDNPENILVTRLRKYNPNKTFCNLENLFFTVLENDDSNLGIIFLPYIVYSTTLKNFYFSLKSTLFTNAWVEWFLTCFNTKHLEAFVIDVPNHAFSQGPLSLTMTSIDHIISKCPQIKTIGNLFAWCISVEEMTELCRLKKIENSDLDLIYHPVPVHMNF